MSAETSPLAYEIVIAGERYRLCWLGIVDVPVSRVRALAFPEPGRLLLVHGDDGLQLPGGGVEARETPFEALVRELQEEAAASIVTAHRLGAFQVDGLSIDRHEIHDFYACRVSLSDDWVPAIDISARITVPASGLLDALPWGRSDPKAAFLLRRALEAEPSLW